MLGRCLCRGSFWAAATLEKASEEVEKEKKEEAKKRAVVPSRSPPPSMTEKADKRALKVHQKRAADRGGDDRSIRWRPA
ncbi:hypothetical protein PG996_016081 [Apiospora saccharicola]|uniref:Uncharacterized protein n=1 Tax=Apiospora saccharicola TaxID=335842 RepID=A0ABR1TN46_9PEZI